MCHSLPREASFKGCSGGTGRSAAAEGAQLSCELSSSGCCRCLLQDRAFIWSFAAGFIQLLPPKSPGKRAQESQGAGVYIGKAEGGVEHQGQSSEGSGAGQGGRPNGLQWINNASWGKLLPHHDHRGFCSMAVPPGEGGSPYFS